MAVLVPHEQRRQRQLQALKELWFCECENAWMASGFCKAVAFHQFSDCISSASLHDTENSPSGDGAHSM